MAAAQQINNFEPTQISAAELVSRATALSRNAADRAAQTEQARRISEETVQEMEAKGLTSLLRPRRWGGLEMNWRTFLDTVVAGSRGCGSTGWILSLLNSHNWVMAQFPEAAQQRVWGSNPLARISTSFMPTGKGARVDGGIRISGRWQWSSGVDVCGWALVSVLMPPRSGEGPPRIISCLVERKDFKVEDTWYNVGLRGTGSNDILVDDVFIADDMTLDLIDLREGVSPGNRINTGGLYQLPMYTALPLSIAAAALGIAQGARETWIATTREKVSSSTREQVSGQVPLQTRLADADVEIDLAEMLLHRVTDSLETGSVSLLQRYRNRRDFSYAIRIAYGAVDKLFQMGGARGLVDSNPLQRAWRDLHSASCHVALSPDIAAENQGRSLLGLDRNPSDPFF